MNERELFLKALEIDDRAEQEDWLRSACSDDSGLFERVRDLLATYDKRSHFLETPAVEQIVGRSPEQPNDSPRHTSARGSEIPTVDFQLNNDDARTERLDDLPDEVPLGYLEPSSRDDSLGRLGHDLPPFDCVVIHADWNLKDTGVPNLYLTLHLPLFCLFSTVSRCIHLIFLRSSSVSSALSLRGHTPIRYAHIISRMRGL